MCTQLLEGSWGDYDTKPGKPVNEVTSYRPISLLPILSKLLEKLFLKRLKPILDEKQIIPTHQFGFRNKHSTIDQVHRITATLEKALEEKQVCSTLFLDVAQAFDRVWHEGLLHKIELLLPSDYRQLLVLSHWLLLQGQTRRTVLRAQTHKSWCPTRKCTRTSYTQAISPNPRELQWWLLLMIQPSWQ